MEAVNWAAVLPALFDLGGWGFSVLLMVYVVRLMATGAWVPRRIHDDALAAIKVTNDRLDAQAKSLDAMADSLKTLDAFIHALPEAAAQVGRRPTRGGR